MMEPYLCRLRLLRALVTLQLVRVIAGFGLQRLSRAISSSLPLSSSTSSSSPYSTDRISFGEQLDLRLDMSATEEELEDFLSEPRRIIEQAWDTRKVKDLGNGKYLLRFITIPVLDIVPEIECLFVYEDQKVKMRSGKWKMIQDGSIRIDEDTTFLESFDISLKGEIKPSPTSMGAASAVGWIEYSVSARKPQIFSTFPFLLPNTIDFVKYCVKDFVLRSFPLDFTRAYETYSEHRSTNSLHVRETNSDTSQFEAWETLEIYQLPSDEKKKIIDKFTGL